MSDSNDLSVQAVKLMTFFNDQGFPAMSELAQYLDTDGVGKRIRRVGTSAFGIRHKFKEGMSDNERMMIYAQYSNSFHLGSFSGEKRPLETLQEIKDVFPGIPLKVKQEIEYFSLGFLKSITEKKDPEIGEAFIFILDP
jgi:hypothetical protein